KKTLYKGPAGAIMIMAFLRGLEKAPTFLVPIINPPFADNSPHFSGTPDTVCEISASSGDLGAA
ncbi:MAG: hypothetical protein JW775_05440, partial [Candidatus Aminicenantes bacterium]|nr:hypothetical protein [Candidatus Aminicenantes bacterium]